MPADYTGFLLQNIPYGESGRIVKVYTQEDGVQSFFLRASKKGKSNKSVLQPLAKLELIISSRKNGNLPVVRELFNAKPYRTIYFDMIKSCQTMFLAELFLQSLKEEVADENLFGLLEGFTTYLDCQPSHADFHLLVMVKLLKALGVAPSRPTNTPQFFNILEGEFQGFDNNSEYLLGLEETAAFYKLLGIDFDGLANCKFGNTLRRSVFARLIDYYKLHLHGQIKLVSHEVLETVLKD